MHLIQGETEGNLFVPASRKLLSCWGAPGHAAAGTGGHAIASPKPPTTFLAFCSQTQSFSEERWEGVTQGEAKHGRAVMEAAESWLLAPDRVVCPSGHTLGQVQGKLWERKAPESLTVTFLCPHHPSPAHIGFLPALVVTAHD